MPCRITCPWSGFSLLLASFGSGGFSSSLCVGFSLGQCGSFCVCFGLFFSGFSLGQCFSSSERSIGFSLGLRLGFSSGSVGFCVRCDVTISGPLRSLLVAHVDRDASGQMLAAKHHGTQEGYDCHGVCPDQFEVVTLTNTAG
jgi:hypothetical protein